MRDTAEQTEPDHRQPPHHDRADDHKALAPDLWQPAGEHPAGDGARPDRCRQQRHDGAALDRSAEALVGDLREQRPRHTEDHRDEVDDERHQHNGVTREVGEPVPDRAEPPARRPADAGVSGRHRTQPHGRPNRRGAGDRVEQVQRGQVHPAQQHPGQQRPDDRAELHHGHVQRVGGGQLIAGQHPRNRRRAGRRVDREERLLHGEQTQHNPDVVRRQRRLRPQQQRRHRQPAGRDDEQDAPIHRVGPCAAPQPEHDQRHQREQPGQTDVRRIPGERVDLHRDGEDRQVPPDDGDDTGQPQPTEVAGAQRRDVSE